MTELLTSAADRLLRLREVDLPRVLAKRKVTHNLNLFLAIRQLVAVYGVLVRFANGFYFIQGVLDVIFDDTEELRLESRQTWKARSPEPTSTSEHPSRPSASPNSE
jgi:hypothetical protein